MTEDEKLFITQAIQVGVQPLHGKVESIKDAQERDRDNTDKKFEALFDIHNKEVAPALGDIRWLKILLGGCWMAVSGLAIKILAQWVHG